MLVKAEKAASNLDPEYLEISRETSLGRVPVEDLDAALSAQQITLRQYDDLTKRADVAAKRGGDVTKRPEFKIGEASVQRTVVSLEKSLLDSVKYTDAMATALTPSQKLAVENVRTNVESTYRQRVAEFIDAGIDPSVAASQAAAEAREAAAAGFGAVAAETGLGEHASDPVQGPVAPIAAKSNVPPQLAREAQETLTPAGLTALDRLGGFGARSADLDKITEAAKAFVESGSLTPWGRSQYRLFLEGNPGVQLGEAEFIEAFFYAAAITGASGSE
jgi:hypothetical protein